MNVLREDALDLAAAKLETAPIARWLDMTVKRDEEGLLYRLKFADRHIGNPVIRALHGGVIAAFLDFAAQLELTARIGAGAHLSTATFSIDYLTSSRPQDMEARVRVARLGRRVSFLDAVGWQASRDRPVAEARVCVRTEGS